MYCENCGAKASDEAKFCSQCGSKLNFSNKNEQETEIIENPVETESVIIEKVDDVIETEEQEISVVPLDNDLQENAEADVLENNDSERIEEIVCITEQPLEQNESAEQPENVEQPQETQEPESVEVPEEVQENKEASQPTEPQTIEVNPLNDKNDDIQNQEFTWTKTTKAKLPKQTKTANKTKRVGAHIACVFISILLALFMITTVAVVLANALIDTDMISSTLTNLDLGDIEIDDVSDKQTLEDLGLICESDNVLDVIYDNIDQSALKEPLSKDQFEEIITNKEFVEYIAENSSKNISRLVSGKPAQIVSADDICDFLEKEDKIVEDIVGYTFDDEMIENLRERLDESYKEIFESLKIESLDDVFEESAAAIIEIVFSDWLLIVLIIIDILLIVLLFLVISSFRLGFVYTGITSIVVSAIYLIASIPMLFGLFELIFDGMAAQLITQASSAALVFLIIICSSILLIGVLMLVTAKIIKLVTKRRALKN